MSPGAPPSPVLIDAACCPPLDSAALTAAQAAALAPAFKALGDPVRLRLLSMIAAHRSEVCVCDLTGAFEVTGPTISHHLKVLREVGLIAGERRGTWVYYWVVPGVLGRLGALLGLPGPVEPDDRAGQRPALGAVA